MNILLINSFDTGGAAKACIRLHYALLDAGVNSKLLTLNSSGVIPERHTIFPNENTIVDRLKNKVKNKHNKKQIYLLNKNKPKNHSLFSLINNQIYKHNLFKWADIINLHWVSQFIDWPSFFKINTPIVWTMHDMFPFTGGCHYAENCIKYESDCNPCFQIPTKLSTFSSCQLKYKQKILKKTNLNIVSPSNWLSNISQKSQLFKTFPHHVINNSIPENTFKYIEKKTAKMALGLSMDIPHILFIADNINLKLKGLYLLKEAIHLLKNRVQLITVGNGYIDIPNVISLGKIKDEKFLNIIYSACDLFVTPSLQDNFPNVILESLISGTPVVGFKTGGIPEIIETNKNGILVENMTADCLATGINDALDFHFDYMKIHEKSKILYSQANQSEKYIDLFKSILNDPS